MPAFLKRAFVIAAALLIASPSFSQDEELIHNTLSGGLYEVDGLKTNTLFWKGNFNRGNFLAQLDINLLLTGRRPEGFESVVLRRLDYDTGTEGFLYEPIVDLNYGQGLVMKHFSTLNPEPAVFNNSSVGCRLYYLGDSYDFETFGTWSHVWGLRASQDLFGLTVGETLVTDADDEATAYSLDLWAPVFGDFDFYSEAAKMDRMGSGYSAGFHWGYDIIAVSVSAKLEWRRCDSDFVPGYFDWAYGINPIKLVSYEAEDRSRSGYYAELQGEVINFIDLTVAYEGYDDSNGAFYLDSWVRLNPHLLVSAYLKQPSFTEYRPAGRNDGILTGGSVRYDLSPNMFLSGTAKKVYDPDAGDVEDSAIIELGLIL